MSGTDGFDYSNFVLDDDVFIGGSAFAWQQGRKEFEWVEDKGYVE